MRKLVFMFLLISSVLMAGFDPDYDYEDTRFNFGLKLGLNSSNITGNDRSKIEDSRYKIDYNLGVELGAFFIFYLDDKISIQPEFMLKSKGFRFNYWSSVEDTYYNYYYLEVPVLFAFKTGYGTKIYIGPYYAKLYDVGVTSEEFDDEEKADQVYNASNKTDYGLVIGAMFRGSQNLMFDIRYERGFNGLLKEDYFEEIYNETFSVSVGWMY